ncbi:MAG: DUF72 domain-containing protein [Desulfurococcaceae archaeon]|nr:DUF72 domain-containing protein [Desulfurococcaceae archaeon]
MRIYVGTSGWLYDWNEGASLDWYIEESGLNAVELNASFYRFPFRNQVSSWSRKGRFLRWSIKVHRSITHTRKMSEKAFEIWVKFYDLFKIMDDVVDFYLFQLPPNFSCRKENLDRIELFNSTTKLNNRLAVEFRHASCFNNNVVKWAEKIGVVVVSIDAPIAKWISSSSGVVYLRMHGRDVWYGYEYSESELEEVAREIVKLKPERIYVFFNNNHWMLENARFMKRVLEKLSS